jgi:Tfp pilus assembly protein PilF
VNLASIYLKRGSLGEAEQMLRDAIRINPNIYEVRINMARLMIEKGDLTEALNEVRRALALDETDEAKQMLRRIESME